MLHYQEIGIPKTLLKNDFDILQEIGVTIAEARLYGLELSAKDVAEEVLDLASSGIRGLFVLSIPAALRSVRDVIAASGRIVHMSRGCSFPYENGKAYVERDDLPDLADAANPRQTLCLRLLPFNEDYAMMEPPYYVFEYECPLGDRKKYCRGRIEHFLGKPQAERLKLLDRHEYQFEEKHHARFNLELATAQEVVSAFNRHFIANSETKQIYGDGAYLTDIEVPTEDSSIVPRLCIDTAGDRLRLFSTYNLEDAFYSSTFSVGRTE